MYNNTNVSTLVHQLPTILLETQVKHFINSRLQLKACPVLGQFKEAELAARQDHHLKSINSHGMLFDLLIDLQAQLFGHGEK